MIGKIRDLKLFRASKTGNEWWVLSPAIIAFDMDKSSAMKTMRALNATLRDLFEKKKIGGKYARRKGLTFERELAIKLRTWFPKARRQLEFQADCALGVDLAETGNFKFQCKKLKGYASVNTINEIQCDRELMGDVPVLVTAADGLPAMVVMHLEDFLDLLPKPLKPKTK